MSWFRLLPILPFVVLFACPSGEIEPAEETVVA